MGGIPVVPWLSANVANAAAKKLQPLQMTNRTVTRRIFAIIARNQIPVIRIEHEGVIGRDDAASLIDRDATIL
jgi:hypothetical protein